MPHPSTIRRPGSGYTYIFDLQEIGPKLFPPQHNSHVILYHTENRNRFARAGTLRVAEATKAMILSIRAERQRC